MHAIGPYTFTETDARRTVSNADTIWTLFGERRDPATIEHLRPALSGDLHDDLHAVWSAWRAAGPTLRAAGQLPLRAEGAVARLHLGSGGLPKLPVDRVTVGWHGVDGDRQATRSHHGRPWQALCVWSNEVIDTLHADGHPIAPGLAGENITLTAIPWNDVRAGVRLRVGEVLCEVSAFAIPCFQNRAWFKDGDFGVIHHQRGPVSRVYATVLEPGAICVGDVAVLEP